MQPMSAFEWKDDSQIRTILRRNRRLDLAAGDPAYARFSPFDDLRAGLWNVALRL